MDATIAVPLILLLLCTCRSHGSTPLQSKSELRLSALTTAADPRSGTHVPLLLQLSLSARYLRPHRCLLVPQDGYPPHCAVGQLSQSRQVFLHRKQPLRCLE